MIQDLLVYGVYIAYAVALLLAFGTLLTWVERKQAAVMADRIGANRAYIRLPFTRIKLIWIGLFHGLADGLKMLLKEDFKPNTYDNFAYRIAPWVVFTPVLLVFAVVPFGGELIPARIFSAFPSVAEWFGDRVYPMQIARLDAGLLLFFAFGGLPVIGAMLAGWSSSNKFSMLGALRAGSQMISYELVMGLTVLGLVLIYGTADLVTKKEFRDHRLHVEFLIMKPRGNSGVYHSGRWETQILDSFGLEGRDNECGGIYSVARPRLNMCLPPLSWQTYDVAFKAATFDAAGQRTAWPRITVRLNGVVVHEDLELKKDFTTAAPIAQPLASPEGPIHL